MRVILVLLIFSIGCKSKEKETDKNIQLKSMKELLHNVWNSDSFKNGNTNFFLSNYYFFRFLDENEYNEINSDKNVWLDYNKNKFGTKRVVCIADYTGDREHYAYILVDENDFKVYMHRFIVSREPTKTPVLLSESLIELFGAENFTELFTDSKNSELWSWLENCAMSYEIPKNVPKGVIPKFDLREYFHKKKNTFISDNKEFNLEKFKNYFERFGLKNEIPDNFYVFGVNKTLMELINKLNGKSNKFSFKIVRFRVSGFWGIYNDNEFDKSQLDEFKKLGIIN